MMIKSIGGDRWGDGAGDTLQGCQTKREKGKITNQKGKITTCAYMEIIFPHFSLPKGNRTVPSG